MVAVDAAVAAAKAESVAAKPLSKVAAVLAEVKPKHVLAAGASVAAVVGANNFTSGIREIGKATAEAIRRASWERGLPAREHGGGLRPRRNLPAPQYLAQSSQSPRSVVNSAG